MSEIHTLERWSDSSVSNFLNDRSPDELAGIADALEQDFAGTVENYFELGEPQMQSLRATPPEALRQCVRAIRTLAAVRLRDRKVRTRIRGAFKISCTGIPISEVQSETRTAPNGREYQIFIMKGGGGGGSPQPEPDPTPGPTPSPDPGGGGDSGGGAG